MDLEILLDSCEHEQILFSYNGVISQNFVISIEKVINDILENHDGEVNTKISRNLFSIAVEQLQNMLSYSKDNIKKTKDIFESSGVCIIGYDEIKEKYFIKTLNVIKDKDIDKVKRKIDRLNEMDDKEKRVLKNELIRSGDLKHDRGAGIGFIEMARKSSEKIQYNFFENKNEKLFELTIYI